MSGEVGVIWRSWWGCVAVRKASRICPRRRPYSSWAAHAYIISPAATATNATPSIVWTIVLPTIPFALRALCTFLMAGAKSLS